MAYDSDMQFSPVVNMALRDDPMMWLTPLPRPILPKMAETL